MTAWIHNQRTGAKTGPFAGYVEAAEFRRDVLRPRLAPNAHCPFAIRVDDAIDAQDAQQRAADRLAAAEIAIFRAAGDYTGYHHHREFAHFRLTLDEARDQARRIAANTHPDLTAGDRRIIKTAREAVEALAEAEEALAAATSNLRAIEPNEPEPAVTAADGELEGQFEMFPAAGAELVAVAGLQLAFEL